MRAEKKKGQAARPLKSMFNNMMKQQRQDEVKTEQQRQEAARETQEEDDDDGGETDGDEPEPEEHDTEEGDGQDGEEEEDDEIECVVAERVHRKRAQFQVRYVGYNKKHDEWISAEVMLETAAETLCKWKAEQAEKRQRDVSRRRREQSKTAAVKTRGRGRSRGSSIGRGGLPQRTATARRGRATARRKAVSAVKTAAPRRAVAAGVATEQVSQQAAVGTREVRRARVQPPVQEAREEQGQGSLDDEGKQGEATGEMNEQGEGEEQEGEQEEEQMEQDGDVEEEQQGEAGEGEEEEEDDEDEEEDEGDLLEQVEGNGDGRIGAGLRARRTPPRFEAGASDAKATRAAAAKKSPRKSPLKRSRTSDRGGE